MKKTIFSITLLLYSTILTSNLLAAENYSLIGNLKEDFTYTATSPSRMDKKSTRVTLGLLGIGAFLYSQDEKIRDYFQDHKTSTLDNLSPVAVKFGDGLYDLGFIVIYGGSGYLIENKKMQKTSILSFESFIVANTFGIAAKVGIGRARPYTEERSGSYTPFSTDSAHTAMPSGHTTSAFSIASVFADEYDNNPVVGVAAYGLASMVALERIYEDAHWASDVFAGAVIGTVVGKSIVYLHKGKKMENSYLVPVSVPSEGRYGMMAVVRF